MSTTELRLSANQANALKSTGPISISGKARSCRNSTRHGLLSTGLFLDHEDPAAFETMLEDLQQALRPVGQVELALVERIAIALWRQRRLVAAETANLTIGRRNAAIAKEIARLHEPKLGHDVGEDDLAPYDTSQLEWVAAVIVEIEALTEISFETLPDTAPLVWAQLESDVEDGQSGPQDYVKVYKNGLTGYIAELLDWCRSEQSKAERRPQLLALAEQVSAERLVLSADDLELLARYQTTLDNQLYKALRALRDAQEWRFRTLEATASPAEHGKDRGIRA